MGSRVDSNVVNENVSYYEEYIATQVRTGRTEEEVIEELGDPRLLARSIAEAKERKGGGVKTDADTEEKKPFLILPLVIIGAVIRMLQKK